MSWSSMPNMRGHTKINAGVKTALYNWIPHHPQVVESPKDNDCINVSIDIHSENTWFQNFD